jgi:hypothetical protein
MLPRRVSNIVQLIPSRLPRLRARSAMRPAIAAAQDCYRIGSVQTGNPLELQRRPQPQPASFYVRRFPLSCTPYFSSWRERRACYEFLKQGHRLSPLPKEGRDNAQLFAQPRTLRIRQIDSLNFSTETSISPLRAFPILHSTRSNFHELSRAAGPTRQIRKQLRPNIECSVPSRSMRAAQGRFRGSDSAVEENSCVFQNRHGCVFILRYSSSRYFLFSCCAQNSTDRCRLRPSVTNRD